MTTDAAHGFTLGSLLDRVTSREGKEIKYMVGKEEMVHMGTLLGLVKRLGLETGKMVRLSSLKIWMRDVVVASEEERSRVRDV